MIGRLCAVRVWLPCVIGILLACAGCAMTSTVVLSPVDSARIIPSSPGMRLLGQATAYVSAGGESVEVVHDVAVGSVIVKLPDGSVEIIPEEIAGVDGRYRNKRLTVWENDGTLLLWIDGKLVFSGKSVN